MTPGESAGAVSAEAPPLPAAVDLVVVGGGTAGIVAASSAAGFGARVVLIERDRTGGDCLWTGCVPSKALLSAASTAAAVPRGRRFGVDAESVTVDFSRVMRHVREAIAAVAPHDSPETLTAAGVRVVNGSARFTGPRTLVVGGDTVTFAQAVLATGARPVVPTLPGIEDTDFLTSETVWQLTDLPARLTVLGGGSIGCELAQAFARLGSAVTLVESADTVLPREDPDAAAALTEALRADGVEVLTAAAGRSVTGRTLTLTDGRRIGFDRLLVAVGRAPNTASMGLDRAGVTIGHRGHVVVDDRLRTSNPRIWAAGDLTGHPQFTHVAGMHGSIAATNAVLGLRRTIDRTGMPRVTFTDPEVAAVGAGTTQVPRGLRVRTLGHEQLDRAVAEGRTRGFTRLVLDGKRRIVGATVVGPRAGETIGELALAVGRGLRTRDLAGVTHPYPTYNDGPWNAAVADVRDQLAGPVLSRAVTALVRVRRAWLRAQGARRRPARDRDGEPGTR